MLTPEEDGTEEDGDSEVTLEEEEEEDTPKPINTRFIHYGQSILMTVPMKNTKNFTAMYSTIIKSLYSGFI